MGDQYQRIINEFIDSIANDAEQLHQVALSWNWDSGVAALQRVVTAPGCDLATALHIFHDAEADYFLNQQPDALDEYEQEIHALIVAIVEAVQANRYKTAQFQFPTYRSDSSKFKFMGKKILERWQATLAAGPSTYQISEVFFTLIEGRTITSTWAEGLPPHVWDQLDELDRQQRKLP